MAGALFAAVFALREFIGGSDQAVSLLYVLPISLVAVTFGRVPGLLASAGGFAAFVFWVIHNDVSLGLARLGLRWCETRTAGSSTRWCRAARHPICVTPRQERGWHISSSGRLYS